MSSVPNHQNTPESTAQQDTNNRVPNRATAWANDTEPHLSASPPSPSVSHLHSIGMNKHPTQREHQQQQIQAQLLLQQQQLQLQLLQQHQQLQAQQEQQRILGSPSLAPNDPLLRDRNQLRMEQIAQIQQQMQQQQRVQPAARTPAVSRPQQRIFPAPVSIQPQLPTSSTTRNVPLVQPQQRFDQMMKSVSTYNAAPPNNSESAPQQRASSSLLYSPTFQCFTSLPFYASLLLELTQMAKAADQLSATCREVIWSQLFALIGTSQQILSIFALI